MVSLEILNDEPDFTKVVTGLIYAIARQLQKLTQASDII